MWDEEINKKIKDAADQYHPAYDDDAWSKMEQLLDEHLPQKKDRRRIIYLIPLMMLLGGLLFFVIFRKEPLPFLKSLEKNSATNNSEKSRLQNASPVKVVPALNAGVAQKSPVTSGTKGNKVSNETSVNHRDPGTKNIDKLSSHGNVALVKRRTQLTSTILAPGTIVEKSGDKIAATEVSTRENSSKVPGKETNDQTANQSNNGITSDVEKSSVESTDNNAPAKVNADNTTDKKEPIKAKDVAKVDNKKAGKSNAGQKKMTKSFIQNLGFGVTIGPDVSTVRLNNAGKIDLTYGAELNYSFNNKFTLRTGFYVARKIYSVGQGDYHIQPGSAANAAYLQSVDANCKVYEIPLTLSYNFGRVKNHNWFASTGLSSYLMKKESYEYYYKYPSGNTDEKFWSVSNKNKHYFSVLDISGGYEYSIDKRFSFRAEPYVKIPLSGIGAGKIKLNSAGVLFTISVKPFLK